MANKSYKYVHGSIAEKLEDDIYYDPYEQNAILKSKKIARNNAKLKAKILFNILVIFIMSAIIIFRYAQISQINYNSNKLNKEYVAMQNENDHIEIEIEKAMDLNSIREVAENKLSMHKPDKSQIVYVTIPKADLTILANKEQSKILTYINNFKQDMQKLIGSFL